MGAPAPCLHVIEGFLWTAHAEDRAAERGLTRLEVEAAVQDGDDLRLPNPGPGDWRVFGTCIGGGRFAVVYDLPALGDERVARLITMWRLP